MVAREHNNKRGGVMFYLILTFCTTAAMDDCTTYQMGRMPTEQQCQALASVHRQILEDGPDRNYRLECKQDV